MSKIVTKFNSTGICLLDTEYVIRKWNHLYHISEWRMDNKWTFVKYVRKDSPATEIKVVISEKQARKLIDKLDLLEEGSPFRSGFSWRRKVDADYLDKWRQEKFSKKH